ncbi:MAG: hypothetical protein HY611_08130 [Elusimicrobia bacterium]|nr:hypothetical protein [Elusimicrobiota bacterium]
MERPAPVVVPRIPQSGHRRRQSFFRPEDHRRDLLRVKSADEKTKTMHSQDRAGMPLEGPNFVPNPDVILNRPLPREKLLPSPNPKAAQVN